MPTPMRGCSANGGGRSVDEPRWLRIPAEGPSERPDVLLLQLLRRNFFYVSTTIRRATLEELGGFDERLRGTEDYELWLRIVGNGGGVVRVPGPLALYRERADSLSSDHASMFESLSQVYTIVRDEHQPTDEARTLASRRLAECQLELEDERNRRKRYFISLPRRLVGWIRWTALERNAYLVAPPPPVARSFPDLRAL